jgi:hypothetical protein
MSDGATLDGNQSLLTRLGAVARAIDGPPDLVYEMGRAAFAWRNVDSELALLMADSRLESSMVRGRGPDDRLLSFATGAMTIEVQVSVRRGTRRLLGQVSAGAPVPGGVLHLDTTTGAAPAVPVDALGRFEVTGVPSGPVRLRVEAPGLRSATTVWVDL